MFLLIQCCCFSVFVYSVVPPTLELSQKISITEVKMGEDVTLRCKTAGYDQRMVYWHKLEFGFMIETIAFGSSPILPLQREFNNSRFKATKSGNEYFLEIKNVSKEDQATYFCQAGTSYTMSFINGSHLVVKGKEIAQFTPQTEAKREYKTMSLYFSLSVSNKDLMWNLCRRETK